MEESENGASLSLSIEALQGEPGGGGSFTETLKNMEKKALETNISLQRGPIGEPRGGDGLPGTSTDGQRMAMETEHLSLWQFCKGNLEEGFL